MAASKAETYIYTGETPPPILDANITTVLEAPITTQAQFVSIDEPYYADETANLLPHHYSNSFDDDNGGGGGDDDDIHKDDSDNHTFPFRDWIFGVLFWFHICVIVYIGITVSPHGYEKFNEKFPTWADEVAKGDDVTPDDIEHMKKFISDATDYVQFFPMRILICILIPSTLLAFLYAMLIAVCIIKPYTTTMVKASLYATVTFTTATMMSIFFSAPSISTFLLAVLAVGASVFFVSLLWPMIPFAAINLEVALDGISHNCGIYVLALFLSHLSFAWMVYLYYALMGMVFYDSDLCDPGSPNTKDGEMLNVDNNASTADNCPSDGWIFILFLISLYWTSSVILNTVQVTVAGVMSTWCFDKEEAHGCCSSAVWDSLVRSVTFSFGSICLGSFLEGIISVIRCLVRDARSRQGNDACSGVDGLCLCVSECVTRLLEDILDVFNRWAYVFVGVYGYPYVQSGRRVMTLFKSKGWTAITTENLAGYVLGFATLVVGVLTGISSYTVERLVNSMYPDPEYESFVFGPLPGYRFIALATGFIIGCVISSVMMNVVKGATNTLIVCWADSPAQFKKNHPEMAERISNAWSQSFPTVMMEQQGTEPTAVVII